MDIFRNYYMLLMGELLKVNGKDLSIDGITVGKRLGVGAQGFGVFSFDGNKVVKIITDNEGVHEMDNTQYRQLFYELKILTLLKHPNIVIAHKFVAEMYENEHATEVEDNYFYYGLVLESLSVPLDSIIYGYKKIEFKLIKELSGQLISAVNYLYELDLVHRDIKPSNIMLNDNGLLKITDFGSIQPLGMYHPDDNGTIFYKPPEVIMGYANIRNTSFDLWSAVCTILEMITKEPVFYAPGAITKDVLYRIATCLNDKTVPAKLPKTAYNYFEYNKNLKELNEMDIGNNKDKTTLEMAVGVDNYKILIKDAGGDFENFKSFVESVLVFNQVNRQKPDKEFLCHPFLTEYSIDVFAEDDKRGQKLKSKLNKIGHLGTLLAMGNGKTDKMPNNKNDLLVTYLTTTPSFPAKPSYKLKDNY